MAARLPATGILQRDNAIAEPRMQLAVGGADNKTVSWRGRLASVSTRLRG